MLTKVYATEPSSAPLFSHRPKSCIITTVASLAIASLVLGTLALLINLNIPLAGLTALSHIPLPISIGLMCSGVAGITALVLQKVCKNSPSPKVEENNYHRYFVTDEELNEISFSFKSDHTSEEMFSLSKVFDYREQNEIKKSLKHLNILCSEDLAERLTSIYGATIPKIEFPLKETFNPYKISLCLKILLCANEEFLNLKLKDVEDVYTSSHHEKEFALLPSVISLRLLLIEKNEMSLNVFDEIVLSDEITLRQFRSKNIAKESNFLKERRYNYLYELLSCKQIRDLLKHQTDKSQIEILFPIGPHASINLRTKSSLQLLTPAQIKDHVPNLSSSHLPLLSHEQLSNESFPWEEIIEREKLAEGLFINTDTISRVKTLKPFNYLKLQHIQILVHKKQSNKNYFFCSKHIRLLPEKLFKNGHFPWDSFANCIDICEDMFPVNDDNSRRIINYLSSATLCLLIDKRLFADRHLDLLSDEQIKADDFPWENFLEKENGRCFRLNTAHDISQTSRNLQRLTMKTVQLCIEKKVLNKAHFKYFSTAQLADKNFPWDSAYSITGVKSWHASWLKKREKELQKS